MVYNVLTVRHETPHTARTARSLHHLDHMNMHLRAGPSSTLNPARGKGPSLRPLDRPSRPTSGLAGWRPSRLPAMNSGRGMGMSGCRARTVFGRSPRDLFDDCASVLGVFGQPRVLEGLGDLR